MMRAFTLLVLIAACHLSAPTLEPDWLVDAAGVLSTEEKNHVIDRLITFNEETAVEMAYVIVDGTGEQSVITYAEDLLVRWEVGLADVYNGIMIVIDVKERQMYLARGDGIRWILSDQDVGAIEEAMREHLSGDRYYQGLLAGTEEVSRKVAGTRWDVTYYDLNDLPVEGAEGEIIAFEGTVQRVDGDTVFVMDADSIQAKVLLLPGTTPMVLEDVWYMHARMKRRNPLELELLGLEASGMVEPIF